MSALVEAGPVGKGRFISQRKYERYPLTNCTGFALLMCAEEAGLRAKDPTVLIRRGRTLTGKPEVIDGESQGTSVADWLKSWGQMAPWLVIETGWTTVAAFNEGLREHLFTAAVGVDYGELPAHLRRFSPRFTGDHRIKVGPARIHDGRWQWLWVDPLATVNGEAAGFDYPGEWVDVADVLPALRSKGQISGQYLWSARIGKENGLRTNIVLDRPLVPGSTAEVPKGADTWRLEAPSGQLVHGKPAPKVTAPVDSIVTIQQRPTDQSPTGRLVRITGGVLDGAYVRLSAVKVMEPPPAGSDAAAVDAAYARGRADEAALYLPVTDPVFTREVPA